MATNRLLRTDWDVIAGIIAAVVAVVLHLLHVADVGVLLAAVVAALAILLIRDLRRESREEHLLEVVQQAVAILARNQAALVPPEAILVGPGRLRTESERFAAEVRGRVTYFNVCLLMFRPQSLFDKLLRPAIENPLVTSIQFVLDAGEQARWREHVLPKVAACAGSSKVLEPRWCDLDESVSFVLADHEPNGPSEALLSFWGEPFMARSAAQDVPRFIFRIQPHSELVTRLAEMERQYRMRGGAGR